MSQKWVKTWDVESFNSGKKYRVSVSADGYWGCSCPNWIFRRNRPDYKECDHILDKKREISWSEGDINNVLKLTALRVEKLKGKGKSEKEITKDLETILGVCE